MPVFPSEEWVAAWVALANRSPEFEASGKGWEGAVGLVIEADAGAGVAEPTYVRLNGRHGKWESADLGGSTALLDGAALVLRAPYGRWKALIRQEFHPIKGVLQGKIRVEGHLPMILKWTRSMAILVELAGHVETEFLDEEARGSAVRSTDGT